MGKVFWFTGLSGSGKTTLAELAINELTKKGVSVISIDGDTVREKRKVKLGFSEEDIKENNLLILEEVQSKQSEFDVILVPVITPFEEVRKEIRSKLHDVFFLFCSANIDTVSKRDVKGLYQKAEEGLIKDMIGFPGGQRFDVPKDADLVLDTGVNGESVESSLDKTINFISSKMD